MIGEAVGSPIRLNEFVRLRIKIERIPGYTEMTNRYRRSVDKKKCREKKNQTAFTGLTPHSAVQLRDSGYFSFSSILSFNQHNSLTK